MCSNLTNSNKHNLSNTCGQPKIEEIRFELNRLITSEAFQKIQPKTLILQTLKSSNTELYMALAKDELEPISKKLLFSPDYVRFRSVCKSWRSAAPKRPQIPWLVELVPPNDSSDEFQFYFHQFCFESNKFTRIPELPNSLLLSTFKAGSTDFIGSSHGWLALFNRGTLSISLCNPITNSKIDLPNLQFPYVSHDDFCYVDMEGFSFILTSDPHDSLSDCFALLYSNERVVYCKIGCSAWTEMDYIVLRQAHFCSYRGMTFIVSHADVFVCDFGQCPRVRKIVSLSLKDIEIDNHMFRNSYLFELDGDLSLLLAYYTRYCDDDCSDHENDCDCGYIYFRVVKLDLIGCKFVKLEEIKSLGDKALFLSEKNIICLTATKYPGCKENSIYISLMDNHCFLGNINDQERYDFENGSTAPFADEDVLFESHAEYVFWFAPNLLA